MFVILVLWYFADLWFGYLWRVEKEMSERKQKWKFNVEMCYPFDVNMIEQLRVQSEY